MESNISKKQEKKCILVKKSISEAALKENFIKDNKGASLLLVLAVFVVLLVVVMNLLMLVSSSDLTTQREYEAAQTELYLSSVFEVLNEQMTSGTFQEGFVRDETTTIDVNGFEDGAGEVIPVTIEITLTGNLADVQYKITYQGKQYGIKAKYSCRKKDDSFTITLKACEAVEQL